jgi:hypothetical protein
MKGFIIRTLAGSSIRFLFYDKDAPVTSTAFSALLPFRASFIHARVSGQEIWVPDAHSLDIIQENASVFTVPGEVVLGPLRPERVSTQKAIGIYYGEGKGLDSCNIFARVADEDMELLRSLGEAIWKHGMQELSFESWED